MKIDCTRESNISLYDFIGKELWVRVNDCSQFCVRYIRILSIDSKNTVEYNFVYHKYVDNIYLYSNYISKADVDRILNTTRCVPINMLRILSPLQIYTTDEIIDIFENYPYYVG